jgi:hypothetical protein
VHLELNRLALVPLQLRLQLDDAVALLLVPTLRVQV